MTHVSNTQSVAAGGFFGAIEAWFAQALQMWRVRRDIRRTYKELSALTNRELDDLGLTRGDIARVSRESAV